MTGRNGLTAAACSLGLLGLLGVASPVSTMPERASGPALDVPTAGSVQGTVTVRTPPPRRSASRYERTPRTARTVQDLPVLVWVRGRAGGGPSPSSGGPIRMVQRDTLFAPGALMVPAGTTVRFPNEDDFFHNVFSYSDPGRFDLGRYPRGESKSVTFDRPGVVKVYCEVHESMRAVIVVTENPFHARVGADRTFRIDGLPAGTHTLVIWHADLGEVERTVNVTDGGVTRIEVELR